VFTDQKEKREKFFLVELCMSNFIFNDDIFINQCFFSIDTSSSIDKSVPLEMPNQRSAVAQAQGN